MQPCIVYLDQNAWINLSRQAYSTPTEKTSQYSRLKLAAESRRAIFPLSAMHYLETWHRSGWESRHRLATVMRNLSNYCTIAPITKLQRTEVARSVLIKLAPRKFRPIPRYSAIGYGVNHAFASKYGRFRYVASVETDATPEGPAVTPRPDERIDRFASADQERYQWFSLAGFEDAMDIDGLDRITQHRRGARYAEQQQIRTDWLNKSGNRGMLDRFLLSEDFNDLLEDINQTCDLHKLDPYKLIQSREEIIDFIKSVPTRDVFSALRITRHRNKQKRWEQHDFADLLALSVAIPYCDVVVTEKQWCHITKQARLDKKYGTLMVHKLDDALSPLRI